MIKNSPPVALISVTDKTGVIEFAKGLLDLNFQIISTGGTAKLLRESKIPVTEVADFTGSPEVLGGRVKTLHPKIHAGILADKTNSDHVGDLQQMNWQAFDLVAVNLYQFADEARDKNLQLSQAVEFVDIGGPAMLRASAKNHKCCLPVIDPNDYREVLRLLASGHLDISFRQKMAAKVFRAIAAYDQMIADYFEKNLESNQTPPLDDLIEPQLKPALALEKTLRYGENSHQKAALYTFSTNPPQGVAGAEFLQGKELSYNNYMDVDAAAAIVAELSPMNAVTIIKHTNPCGTAGGTNLSARELFTRALMADPKCAFGGVVASNISIDEDAALSMSEIFLECVIAPGYSQEALAIFRNKKNLRLLKSNAVLASGRPTSSKTVWRSISGGLLVQTVDVAEDNPKNWTCVTKQKPDNALLGELSFAMAVCKHVKSNGIVLSSNFQTIGVGAGQMSRIDSTRIALAKARELGHKIPGAVLASDAFFPFRDCLDEAARSGIRAIVQPGGSLRDQESIDAANEHGIIMMMTGIRHFKH